MPAKTASSSSSLPLCPFGATCYRSNPQHKKEYSHDVPECPFGKGCYRQNPAHLKEFRHSTIATSASSLTATKLSTPKRRRLSVDGTPKKMISPPKHLKKSADLDFFASSGCTFTTPTKDNEDEDCYQYEEGDSDEEYEYIPTGKSHSELTAELLKGDCRYPAYTVHFDRSFALDQVFPLLSHAELVAMALVSSNWFRFIHKGASELWKSLYERQFGKHCKCRSDVCEETHSGEYKQQSPRSFFLPKSQLWACGKLEPASKSYANKALLPFLTHHPLSEVADWRKHFLWRCTSERIQNLLNTVGARGNVFHLHTPADASYDLATLRQCLAGWLKTGVVIKSASLEILHEDLKRAARNECNDKDLHSIFDLEPVFQFRAEFSPSVGYIGFTRTRGALLAILLDPCEQQEHISICQQSTNVSLYVSSDTRTQYTRTQRMPIST